MRQKVVKNARPQTAVKKAVKLFYLRVHEIVKAVSQ
jgi:hypothetical protein